MALHLMHANTFEPCFVLSMWSSNLSHWPRSTLGFLGCSKCRRLYRGGVDNKERATPLQIFPPSSFYSRRSFTIFSPSLQLSPAFYNDFILFSIVSVICLRYCEDARFFGLVVQFCLYRLAFHERSLTTPLPQTASIMPTTGNAGVDWGDFDINTDYYENTPDTGLIAEVSIERDGC
jgi:hypothetical protein